MVNDLAQLFHEFYLPTRKAVFIICTGKTNKALPDGRTKHRRIR